MSYPFRSVYTNTHKMHKSIQSCLHQFLPLTSTTTTTTVVCVCVCANVLGMCIMYNLQQNITVPDTKPSVPNRFYILHFLWMDFGLMTLTEKVWIIVTLPNWNSVKIVLMLVIAYARVLVLCPQLFKDENWFNVPNSISVNVSYISLTMNVCLSTTVSAWVLVLCPQLYKCEYIVGIIPSLIKNVVQNLCK